MKQKRNFEITTKIEILVFFKNKKLHVYEILFTCT
jgi:hypothetical protein